ncbi:glycosyltransferase [Streptomyces sp. LX-29]|uniref:glycosyltransferase n=1 Tax=Streptomyces sp. LX-29 TaxID=2900152 RepID=UPI00240D5384|nr:glycosyltransferase [Streptomyces sp. LX-29]WFB09146.1 glycosyltransferase [Streptomyces sp. LX-29]
MSVHSQPAAPYPAASPLASPLSAPDQAPAYPRHVVTAVLVAHDGARWLPDALSGLLGQERPVQNAVAADTGSGDESARLLAEALGPDRVLHLARRSGFGTAVEEAVRGVPVLGPEELPYLKRPSGWDPASRTWRDDSYDLPELPHGEPIQWLWLLHDDCAPAPDALAELLRVAEAELTANRSAAIIGPKLRGWYDDRQLLEVGVSIARSGRRWTGLERREQDQGQHDQVRPVLAVSSAGMLIRRDVWDELGGFDPRLPLMRDDVDLCWRAQAAGHQVLVAPDAVLRHAEASARERRPIDCVGRSARPSPDHPGSKRFSLRGSSPHRVDKSGAVYTLLANTRGALLPYVLLRVVLGTLVRTVAYLVGKVPGQALDEIAGLFRVLLRPERLLAARRRRGRPAVEASELRPLFPPPGATVRATVEQIAGSFAGRSESELAAAGRHGAVESGPGGEDADFLEVEQFARLKRIARKPGPVLFALLLLVSFVACRGLIGTGALSGGALLPAPGDVSGLWARYTDGWHPVGPGTTEGAPPYLAVLATLGTLFLGSTGFTLTLLLVCSVPLAGFTAYFASRPLVESRLLRAWGSVAYAFLPAATGALASGRLGTAVLAVLLPLMARAAVVASGLAASGPLGAARPSWRAAWAYALLLTVTMAFTPVVWMMAVLLGLGLLAFQVLRNRAHLVPHALRLLAVVGTPLLMLAPWSLSLLTHPGRFLDQAGLDYAGGTAGALDLLALSPGGPKAGGSLLLLGFVLAALGALLRDERQLAVRAAWVVGLTGLLFAALTNRSGWAGPATLVYGIAVLSAAMVGSEGVRERVAARSFGWRQPAALLIAVASVAAPLLAALGWMAGGADGPVGRHSPVQVPEFVAAEASTRDQARTLVLDGTAGRVDYVLVRGSGARLGDGELAVAGGADPRLDDVVANLVAGSGADQTSQLSGYAVRYVLVRDSAPRRVGRVLDATPGLARLSQQNGSSLWQVEQRVARVAIVGGEAATGSSGAAAPVPVAAGPVEAHTEIPAGGEGRLLRVADRAAPGWRATLDGKPLKAKTVDGWAQAFELPAAGGRLDLSYETPLTHTAWVWTQGVLAVVLVVLALPGRRREIDDDLPTAGAVVRPGGAPRATIPAQTAAGEGRRARRLRAAADTTQGDQPADPHGAGPDGVAPRGAEAANAAPRGARERPAAPGTVPPPPGAPPTAGQPYAERAEAAYPDQAAAAAADPYAAASQQSYGGWEAQPPYPGYDAYQSDAYQGDGYADGGYPQNPQNGYPQGGYADGGYPYPGGSFGDGSGYGQDGTAYSDGGYPAPPAGPPHTDMTYGGGAGEPRRDGSEQQR